METGGCIHQSSPEKRTNSHLWVGSEVYYGRWPVQSREVPPNALCTLETQEGWRRHGTRKTQDPGKPRSSVPPRVVWWLSTPAGEEPGTDSNPSRLLLEIRFQQGCRSNPSHPRPWPLSSSDSGQPVISFPPWASSSCGSASRELSPLCPPQLPPEGSTRSQRLADLS